MRFQMLHILTLLLMLSLITGCSNIKEKNEDVKIEPISINFEYLSESVFNTVAVKEYKGIEATKSIILVTDDDVNHVRGEKTRTGPNPTKSALVLRVVAGRRL